MTDFNLEIGVSEKQNCLNKNTLSCSSLWSSSKRLVYKFLSNISFSGLFKIWTWIASLRNCISSFNFAILFFDWFNETFKIFIPSTLFLFCQLFSNLNIKNRAFIFQHFEKLMKHSKWYVKSWYSNLEIVHSFMRFWQ